MTSFITSSPCQRKTGLRAAQVLRHLQQKYIFVKKKTSAFIPKQLGPQPRNTRSDASSIPGTTYCPWKWIQDDDPARMPRSIMKAVCPGCAHFCRPVYYYHNVLVPKCDKTTGEKVWKWKEKELAVAYVYDPYNWINYWIEYSPKKEAMDNLLERILNILLFYLVFIWKNSFRTELGGWKQSFNTISSGVINIKEKTNIKFQITLYVLFI